MKHHGACLILLAALVFVQAVTPSVLSDLRTTSSLTRDRLEADGEYRGDVLLQDGRMLARVSQVTEDVELDHAPLNRGKSTSSDVKLGAQMRQPHDASWFKSFSDGESTFDADGVERREPGAHTYFDRDGVNPGMGQLATPTALPAQWFHETKSGGPKQAWQTFYPAVENFHPRGSRNPAWRSGHQVYEQYQPSTGTAFRDTMLSHQGKPAEWFDGSVRQYDAFGRLREPTSASGRRYLDWTVRSRNTTLTCGPPGCVANASLNVFDSATELHRSCRLSIKVHATDFDDEYSKEDVEWFKVNDKVVNSKCDPMAKFCNDSVPVADRPWYPCLTDMHLDSLIDTGSLNVSGKISPMVDECPADGNLLSGIVIVTCFVRPRPEPTTPPPVEIASVTTPASTPAPGPVSALLQCAEPGCEASATVIIDQGAIANQDCHLTVVVNQTDFDGDEGSKEEIEWVKVANATAKEDVTPGRNPCKEAANGQNVSNITYVLLDNYEVPQAALQLGYVVVQAKISDMVDECGSHGYLFDGRATVTCTARDVASTAAGASTAGDATGVAAVATPAPTSAS